MKLIFLLGSRGEWGYVSPIIDRAIGAGHEVKICATNMSVLYEYGDLASKLHKSGSPIAFKILSSVSGDTLSAMAKSIGLLELSLVDYLQWENPDWLILAGDRAEQLAGAIVGAYCYIPTAHIQAGERSGNIDGVARHAITKLVHLHFASNQDAFERLVRMGEEEFRIHLTGAPQLDDISNISIFSISELQSNGIIQDGSDYFVACFHSDTNALQDSQIHIQNLIKAMQKIKYKSIWILPNNDSGGEQIKRLILSNLRIQDTTHNNLDRRTYISLLKHAKFIIGNSSSGILEAPSLHLPAINIGRRQDGRIQGANVLNVDGFDSDQIVRVVNEAVKIKASGFLESQPNPYGDGKSSDRILETLEQTKITSELLQKKISY